MSAIEDVAAERKRQIESEGWSPQHDSAHSLGEMARAAACYAIPRASSDFQVMVGLLWPWDRKWWKPKDRRRDLVRAAALIVAEIDRLDRLQTSKAA
jgi:hypothetical protein